MQSTSKIIYPLPKPKDYTEPQKSRHFFITLRPHDNQKFTNETEEIDKLIKYARKQAKYKSVIIGKEWNKKPLYEINGSEQLIQKYTKKTGGYHYHVIIKTDNSSSPSKKTTIQTDLMKLFPHNLITPESVKVKFMNPNERNALIYTIKDGNYSYDGDITQEIINNSIEIYTKENPQPSNSTHYHTGQLIGKVFDHLLDFCKSQNIKHCNYTPPTTDKNGMMTCDKVELFVMDHKLFIDVDYLIKYFRRETGNLNGDGVKKFIEFRDHILNELEQFDQTVVTNRYVAYDDGNVLVDGLQSKILTHQEATEVLKTYTPLKTYEEDPTKEFKPPLLFYELVNITKRRDEIIKMLRYFLAGEDNDILQAYQLLGAPNTGKSTLIKYIVYHYGPHSKKITKEGKFTFAGSESTHLRWSDELNLYELYDNPDLSEIILPLMERENTDTPVKHKSQTKLLPSLMIFATNPERHKQYYTAIRNGYESVKYGPINKRVVKIPLTETIDGSKIDHNNIITGELAHTSFSTQMKLKIPD